MTIRMIEVLVSFDRAAREGCRAKKFDGTVNGRGPSRVLRLSTPAKPGRGEERVVGYRFSRSVGTLSMRKLRRSIVISTDGALKNRPPLLNPGPNAWSMPY